MHKIDILKLIHNMASQLESCCKDKINAEQEAWWLVEKLTNKSKTWLLSNPNRSFSASEQEQLTQWIIDRVQHNKPLAYILGSVPFCDLEILVKPPILIPRPETEEWVSWLIEQLKQANFTKFIALDLCCGSGCIGLAIAKAFPKSKIIGIDINPEAIKLSIENKNHNKIENIDFIQSDLFENLPSNFSCNLIVSNPPYLAKQELANLDPDVKDWEDHMALVAQDEGMYFYHKIFTESPKFLLPIESSIPQIVVEIGPAQRTIENILPTYKFKNFILYKDMQHQGRWVGCWI
ncbi:MAG: peptide chain release factor N(5)-glutamine methyltransferase [Candidatus Babeliales bacterium]|jgi:release factor glutamine methyltransferase